jgi:cytochrome c55X
MRTVSRLAGSAGLVVTAAFSGVGAVAAEPPPGRQAELTHFVRQDCGSCHGMTLRGGLGPALTRDALAGKPAESLVVTVLYGRPGTPMPPWREFVSETEAAWIVRKLQEGTLGER